MLIDMGRSVVVVNLGLAARFWPRDDEILVYFRKRPKTRDFLARARAAIGGSPAAASGSSSSSHPPPPPPAQPAIPVQEAPDTFV